MTITTRPTTQAQPAQLKPAARKSESARPASEPAASKDSLKLSARQSAYSPEQLARLQKADELEHKAGLKSVLGKLALLAGIPVAGASLVPFLGGFAILGAAMAAGGLAVAGGGIFASLKARNENHEADTLRRQVARETGGLPESSLSNDPNQVRHQRVGQ